MSTPFFKLTHFEVINDYRIMLNQASDMTERVKADLDLASDRAFIQLHQPSLDDTFLQVNEQLRNWPELFDWPHRIFYQQSDLITDIRLFDAEYSRVIDQLTATERKGLVSELDFSQSPFELNGRMKVMSPGAGYSFAQQTKQLIYNLWYQYDGASFACRNLYQRASSILPRLINFMQAAISAYARAKNIDPLSDDSRILTVRTLIQKTERDLEKLTAARKDLSEGYSNLADFLSGALSEFVNLFPSVTIEGFHHVIESAMIRLELAEALTRHTRD
ncbi:hypothetical protein [Pseudomonas sp. ME-P-057]|uniref:hypothetical protein n=1 Tax=Pseudomonas sp. ME-P-057 TaxID=3040321 RepID=UPI002553FD90|nr:hypothetical protein [Pseudomonas sp. ME-P-057]